MGGFPDRFEDFDDVRAVKPFAASSMRGRFFPGGGAIEEPQGGLPMAAVSVAKLV
jgi:hypothetical protein